MQILQICCILFAYHIIPKVFGFLPYPLKNKSSCLTTFTSARGTSNGANDGQHEKHMGRNLALHCWSAKKQEGTVGIGKLESTERSKKQTLSHKLQIMKY